MIIMLFFDSILSLRLETMGVPDNDIGYIFALGCLCYALTSPIVGILCKYVSSRIITLVAFLLAGMSLFLFGPSSLLAFPE